MTKSSDKNKELTQNQTAILITNKQPSVENELSKATLTENNRQQKRNCCSWEKVFSGLIVTIYYYYLLYYYYK